MNILIEAKGLTKRYGDFVLQGLDLAVPAGGVVGLVGANGAGKTTAIKMLLGMVRPEGGTVSLFGEPVVSGPQSTAAQEAVMARCRDRIGIVLDSSHFPDEFTVAQVGRTLGFAYSTWDPAYFKQLIDEYGLAPQKKVKELSRGMGMKLSFAAALAHHPDLLILDEATAGLDPLARGEVLDTLRDFMAGSEERGILMSTHITSDLDKISDYVVCLEAGALRFACETPSITERAGIAHCRMAELVLLTESGLFSEGMRYVTEPFGASVLVPDRFAFAERFPGVALEPASVDSYMGLVLKGELK